MLTNNNNNNNNNKRKDMMQNDPQRSKEKRPKTQEDDEAIGAIGPPLPTATAPEKEKDPTERPHHQQPPLLLPLGKKPKEGQRTAAHHHYHHNHHVQQQLALDPNTANGSLSLSADNRTATYVRQKQPYPAHRERFCYWQQVLCAEPLTSTSAGGGGGPGGGRWFLQVERSGWVAVALAYRSIRRAAVDESLLGFNMKSWSLECYDAPGGGGGGRGGRTRYTFCHNQDKTELPPRGGRCLDDDVGVAVSVDVPGGVLKFYAVAASNKRTLIHTHREDRGFNEPLYPAFRLGWCDSSVSLVQLHKTKG